MSEPPCVSGRPVRKRRQFLCLRSRVAICWRRQCSALPDPAETRRNLKPQISAVEIQGRNMSKKYHVQRREFLSRLPEWGAYVIAVVEDARERHVRSQDHDEFSEYQEINLRISDGSK